MGRKSKLTPERQERIINAIRAGSYVETAAALAGIHRDTLYDWLKRGRSEEEPYATFLAAMNEALASAELRDVMAISKAVADGDWRAAAWRLERKFPRRWGLVGQEKRQEDGAPPEPEKKPWFEGGED